MQLQQPRHKILEMAVQEAHQAFLGHL